MCVDETDCFKETQVVTADTGPNGNLDLLVGTAGTDLYNLVVRVMSTSTKSEQLGLQDSCIVGAKTQRSSG